MKNSVRIILALIIVSFVLSSCNTKMSVMKRRYNKGYYIENNNAAKHNAKTPQAETNAQNTDKRTIGVLPAQTANNTVKNNIRENAAVNNKAVTSSAKSNERTKENVRILKNNSAQQDAYAAVKEPTNIKETFFKEGKKLNPENFKRSNKIFWIIIIVLLVLWLLGLLSGLGNLVNLLLAVALILIILWLLKVI